MKIPTRNPEKHYLPTWMIFSAPGTLNSAPNDDYGGTRPFVASHIRRRKSSSGAGPYSNLPPLVKYSPKMYTMTYTCRPSYPP